MEEKDRKDEEVKIVCNHIDHRPPLNLPIQPGQKIIHTCPGCGNKTILSASTSTTLSY